MAARRSSARRSEKSVKISGLIIPEARVVDDLVDGNAQTADGRFAAHLVGLDSDYLAVSPPGSSL